jgi:hypothetical protein
MSDQTVATLIIYLCHFLSYTTSLRLLLWGFAPMPGFTIGRTSRRTSRVHPPHSKSSSRHAYASRPRRVRRRPGHEKSPLSNPLSCWRACCSSWRLGRSSPMNRRLKTNNPFASKREMCFGLRHHRRMPESVARTTKCRSLVDRAVQVVSREGEIHATLPGVMRRGGAS